MKEKIVKMLNLAPVDFQEFCTDPINIVQLEELAGDLEGVAIGATRLLTYIRKLDAMGLKTGKHAAAVKEANKVVEKVRKAFGYAKTEPVNF